MNTCVPKPLARSPEFLTLDVVGRLALRVVWQRGEERTWSPVGPTPADELFCLEVEASGFFGGPRSRELIVGAVQAMVGSGALVRRGDLLVMKVLSGDRVKGETPSSAAERKRLQRLRDAEDPDRVRERRERGQGRRQGDADPPSAPPSGRDSENVTPNVTPAVTSQGPVPGRDPGTLHGRDPGTGAGRDSAGDGHRLEGVGGEEREKESVSLSLSFPGNPNSDAPATPAPGRDPQRDNPGDPRDVTGAEILGAFNELAKGRVGTSGVGRPDVLARVVSRFQMLGVTDRLLVVMAELAGRGELELLDKRDQVGLGWLAGQKEDLDAPREVLNSWVDRSKLELGRRERERLLAAQQKLALTPNVPAKQPAPHRAPDTPGTVRAGDLSAGLQFGTPRTAEAGKGP